MLTLARGYERAQRGRPAAPSSGGGGRPPTSSGDSTGATAGASGSPHTGTSSDSTTGSGAPQDPPRAHVLAVDDDATNRRLVQRMLAKIRCSCDVLEDGDEVGAALVASGQLDRNRAAAAGFDILKPISINAMPAAGASSPEQEPLQVRPGRHPYDFILLDILMARSQGTDVMRQLKLAGLTVPVLPMTANTSDADCAYYRECGFGAFTVSKPFDTKVLKEAVDQFRPRQPSADDDEAEPSPS